jgi:hypothetical protein
MWQRFTERARKAVFYAQEEAQKRGAPLLGTEDLLLGVLRDSDTTALRVLEKIGLPVDKLRSDILEAIGEPKTITSTDMTLSPRAKRVIDFAYDEARNLNNNSIGTEHLLLGLIRESDGIAARVLARNGADLEKARRELMALQDSEPRPSQPSPPLRRSTIAYSLHSRNEELLSMLTGAGIAEHLVSCMIADADGTCAKVIAPQCGDVAVLQGGLLELIQKSSEAGLQIPPSETIGDLLKFAHEESGGQPLEPVHFLLALLRPGRTDASSTFLVTSGLTHQRTLELAKGDA